MATPSLRIAVADDEPDAREYFERMLPRMGHQVHAVVANGHELLECCRHDRPDFIVTDWRMPEKDGISASRELFFHTRLPILLVSAQGWDEVARLPGTDHLMAGLEKPFKRPDLEQAIQLAHERFAHFRIVEQQTADLEQALSDRQSMEHAKQVLMRKLKLDERGAFSWLHRSAERAERTVADIARQFIANDLDPLSLP